MSQATDNGLRFAPSILQRLGEELVPQIEQAIVELVRNAYDADATTCSIEIDDRAGGSATITVSDNGDGMDRNAITNGWLVLGASGKSSGKQTQRLHRHTVGDKGLGRLAALRAGTRAELVTRPRGGDEAFGVMLDWEQFDRAAIVEDVPVMVASVARAAWGTTIVLHELRRTLTHADYDRLARQLVLLTSPFEAANNFRIELRSPRFPEFEARVDQSYLDEAEYRLEAELQPDGSASAVVYDWKNRPLYRTTSSEWFSERKVDPARSHYAGPPARFELFNYKLTAESFASRGVTVGEVRNWLKVVGGVHVYHRQFRVPPYGDPGYDWLDMNLARARSPEEKPSTNNSIGRVIIDDPAGELLQKTDRVGFIETAAFQEIKRFAKDALGWFGRERLREAERRRDSTRRRVDEGVVNAHAQLEAVLKTVPSKQRDKALKLLNQLDKANQKANKVTGEELLLYRSLATAGATAAVFAHEVGKPIDYIHSAQSSIRRKLKEARPQAIVARIEKSLDTIRTGADRLENFAGMQIDMLRREKRRHGSVDVHASLRALHALWQPVMKDVKVTLELDLAHVPSVRIHGSESLFEAVVTNCLTNIVRAYETPGARTKDRRARIRTRCTDSSVELEIDDNGPGIEMPLSDIWLPGRTTHATGTGFGLTIVKDSVRDLSGEYSARASVDLGGASFVFVFPRLTA